jgi:hypothetical protein
MAENTWAANRVPLPALGGEEHRARPPLSPR